MDFFDILTQIPRGSENEKGASDWVVRFAEERGLEVHQDDGHLDMVCAKDDGVEFDFLTQGLNLLRDGDCITADGTSLGADNGIGVAYILALLDSSDTPHPPLEAVLTSMEDPGRLRRRRLRHDRHSRRVGVDGRAEPGRAHAHGPRAHRRPLRVRHPPGAHQRHHPAGPCSQRDAGPGIRPADRLAVRRRATTSSPRTPRSRSCCRRRTRTPSSNLGTVRPTEEGCQLMVTITSGVTSRKHDVLDRMWALPGCPVSTPSASAPSCTGCTRRTRSSASPPCRGHGSSSGR